MPKRKLPAPSNKVSRIKNLRKDGLIIRFGASSIHVDFFEVILWILLSIPLFITIKDCYVNDLSFEESMKRVGIMASFGFFIRSSPTGALYEKIFGSTFSEDEQEEE